MNNLLEYSDAVRLFVEAGLSESTFRRKVKELPIRRQMPDDKARGALYVQEDVELAISQSRKRQKPMASDESNQEVVQQEPRKENTKRGDTDWARESDLPYMLAYDYEMYGVQNTVDISITHKWWEKNPYMARLLFNADDRREIWGGVTIMPMKEETIFKLLKDEMTERDITPDHILTYEPGNKYIGYVASATVKKEHAMHFRKLLESVFDYSCQQYPDIQVTKLYAYASSGEGWDLIKRLFFYPRRDIGPNAFELDLFERNPSYYLKKYHQCLRSKGADIFEPEWQ